VTRLLGLLATLVVAVGFWCASPTWVSGAQSCSPRPKVHIQTQALTAERLDVTISVEVTAAAPANSMHELRIGQPSQARVDVAGGPTGIVRPANVAFPSGARQASLTVWRLAAGVPTHVPFAVVDDCGPWSTFVGAGPLAGAPPIPPAPTATPTATMPMPEPGAAGLCGERMDRWHPPAIGLCSAGHEHGDPSPDWLAARGVEVSFVGPFNTSAIENAPAPHGKHAGMKGWSLTTQEGVRVYVRYHAATNPHDRSARYHSFQLWMLDPAGQLSHLQGWYNAGDPTPGGEDRPYRRSSADPISPNRRPMIGAISQVEWDAGHRFEGWYTLPESPLHPAFGFHADATTIYTLDDPARAMDPASWQLTGRAGVVRRIELGWPSTPDLSQVPRGRIFTTQFGEVVSGPNDPACGTTTTRFGATYTVTCLEQVIQPTLPAFSAAVTRTFDQIGVRVPN
jgi:hypothetical protein